MGRQYALLHKAKLWDDASAYFKKKYGIRRMTTGLFRRAFRSSIYTRHQGYREMARRCRQIEQGIISTDQVLRMAS